MSAVYIRRLRGVQAEFDAARTALLYVIKHWQGRDIAGEEEVVRLNLRTKQFEVAQQNAEKTYFIRLYAEFEGILKDHLASNLPVVNVPDKPKVDQLISAVTKAEGIKMDPVLRRKMDEVRDYRNSLAHSKRQPAPRVSFVEALARLNTFLAKLPEPLT